MPTAERRYTLYFFIGLFFLLGWSAFDYGGRYLHVQTISQLVSAGLALMLGIQLLRRKQTGPLLDYPLLKPILLFLLVLGMSWIFSVNRLASLEEIWRWVMYAVLPLTIYGWLRLLPEPERKARALITGSLLIGAGIVAIGLMHPTGNEGLSSTFNRTNDLAGYLLLQVPLALHLLLISTRPSARLGHGLLFGVLAAALVMTNSRSSWVACLLACGLVFWFNRSRLRQKTLRWALGGSAVILIAGVAVFWNKIGPRLQTVLSMQILQENATHWRVDLLKGTWNMFLAHPLLGSGPNSFASAFTAYQLMPGYYSINPHNFYFQTLAETGILGLVALLFWIYALVRGLVRRPNVFSLGILAGLAASLIHIGFDIDWSVSAIPILFGVLLGAGLVPATPSTEASEFEPRAAGILLFVSTALALIPSLNYFSARAYGEYQLSAEPAVAQAALKRAMRLAPWPSARHHYSLAQQQAQAGEFEAALAEATQAIQLDMHNARYYKLASDILLRLDRKPEALAMLLRCQELNPYRHPSIYSDVGDFYMVQMQEPLKAEAQYQRGRELFNPETLSHYERYSPEDRYEAFNLLMKLAIVEDKLSRSKQAEALRHEAQQLIHAGTPDMFVSTGYTTPVEALMAYWKQVPEHYRHPRHSFDSLLPGSQVQAPPPGLLDPSRIQFFHVERDLFSARLMYAVPRLDRPGAWLLFEDQLVGNSEGWKIQARRNFNS